MPRLPEVVRQNPTHAELEPRRPRGVAAVGAAILSAAVVVAAVVTAGGGGVGKAGDVRLTQSLQKMGRGGVVNPFLCLGYFGY